ncbi:hypothetical protein HYX13_00635 [Candidatus Woesearchaeota archaeon]|nr:hypothetical protein [Candidatus Woesearchaeota archaeon]
MKNIKKKVVQGILCTTAVTLLSFLIGIRTPKIEENNATEQKQFEQSTLNILTANVARGQGHEVYVSNFLASPFLKQLEPKKNEGSLHALEELIIQENIDLAFFQEIENSFIAGEHQPRRLAQNTQLPNYVFAPNFAHQYLAQFPFTDGNAVIGRSQFYDSQRLSLESEKKLGLSTVTNLVVGSKGILYTKIFYKNQPIHLFCIHLSSSDTMLFGNERESEFKAVFKYVAAHTPAIIAGDFNTIPLSAQRYPFSKSKYLGEKSWAIAQKILDDEGVTLQYDSRLELFNPEGEFSYQGTFVGSVSPDKLGHKADLPDSKETIDYILIAGRESDSLQLKLEETHVDLTHYYSDHAPVLGKVKIVEKKR